MFVGILLRDPARDFGVEFESLRHREIFEISARGQKTIGSHLKNSSKTMFPFNFQLSGINCGFVDQKIP